MGSFDGIEPCMACLVHGHQDRLCWFMLNTIWPRYGWAIGGVQGIREPLGLEPGLGTLARGAELKRGGQDSGKNH